jgi:SAM-dependent methyltransferase
MNDKEASELTYWKHRLAVEHNNDIDDYLKGRYANYLNFSHFFPEINSQTGWGIDVGCGLISIFENTPLNCYAVDPLMKTYKEMIDHHSVIHRRTQGNINVIYIDDYEDNGLLSIFKDESLDWVSCINVIDHTEYDRILLSEMYRVMKPKAKLYFNVNFDPELMPPHHCTLWDMDVIKDKMYQFKLLRGVQDWVESWGKYNYWGLFIKE